MRDIHPTETAGDGKRFRDELHRAKGEDSESLFISCPHCGMINKTNRDNPKNLEGEGTVQISVQTVSNEGTITITEPKRAAGCLLCRHNYMEDSYSKEFFSSVNLAGR